MVVGPDGALPLPWLGASLAETLAHQRGHALLLHGPAGAGALAFGLSLAQGMLCESREGGALACGRCGSCRLVQSHVHPDLFVLLPEVQRRAHGWALAGDDDAGGDEGKRKPSRQIRIDEVRTLIDWAGKTSARGRGKVALLHPAEAMNLQSASALLKTLEEPPPGTRLLLAAGDPEHLLPTVRSRCQRVALPRPAAEVAMSWLAEQGVADAGVLLAAAGGLPLDALALHRAGIDGAAWSALPRAMARGQGAALSGWALPNAVDALLKLCHDCLAVLAGGEPRFFPAASLPGARRVEALLAWQRSLLRVARHDEHPWNEGLMADALAAEARAALTLRA